MPWAARYSAFPGLSVTPRNGSSDLAVEYFSDEEIRWAPKFKHCSNIGCWNS